MLNRDFIVFDVETSTGHPDKCSILQLGACKFSSDGHRIINENFNAYIKNYKGTWEHHSSTIHGLSKEFINKAGNKLEDVLTHFEEWVGNPKKYFLAQWGASHDQSLGLGFDSACLYRAYEFLGKEFPFNKTVWDVSSILRDYLLETAKFKSGQSLGLVKCAELLDIDIKNFKAHDALNDAWLAATIWEEKRKRNQLVGSNGKITN